MATSKREKFGIWVLAGLGLLALSPIVIILLVVFLIWGNIGPDNFFNKNVGQEFVNKYYVTTRLPEYDEKGRLINFDDFYFLARPNPQFISFDATPNIPQYDDIRLGEVLYFQSAVYDNYFEGSSVKFQVTFPCESLDLPYHLSVNGKEGKNKTSYLHTALKEISPDEVAKYCADYLQQ